jgi:hypothetical protein
MTLFLRLRRGAEDASAGQREARERKEEEEVEGFYWLSRREEK